MCGRNRDCLNDDFSFCVSVRGTVLSDECESLLSLVFILKKSFIRCETWLLDTVLFVDRGWPEKVRFSFGRLEVWLDEELNSWVIVVVVVVVLQSDVGLRFE